MQYASMSQELLRNKNFLHFLDNGTPYLDKPPLIFWCTAISFKIFGTSNIAFRIPSLLFSFLAVLSTFKLAKLYYSKDIASYAAIILSSCIGFIVMNSDVRTEIYMIGPMMAAIWQLELYFRTNRWINLISGSILISLSMMGKGPIGIVIPLCVLGLNLMFKNKFKLLFSAKIIMGFIIIIIFLLPMSYGLYTQHGFYGLKFFYWIQSFGRITGASDWSNNTGPFYLLNVFIYSFLPWTFIFLWAFVKQTVGIVSKNLVQKPLEIISYSGFLLPLIILSLSNYKLPHYIYCVFPFAAIVTGIAIDNLTKNIKLLNRLYYLQTGITAFILVLIYSIIVYSFSTGIMFFVFPFVMMIFYCYLIFFKNLNKKIKILIPSIVLSILFSYGFNFGFMLPLMHYQSQSKAAQYLRKFEQSYETIYFYNENKNYKTRSFNYYLGCNIEYIDKAVLESQNLHYPIVIFTNAKGYNELIKLDYKLKILKVLDHFRVSKLNDKFFDPNDRESILEKKFLLKLS